MPSDFSGGILFLVDVRFEPNLTEAAARANGGEPQEADFAL